MSIRGSPWVSVAAGALTLLSACGGGGGGGGTESTLTPYTLSVTVSALNGTVVLQNNGGDNLSTSTNGSITFSATLIAGAPYSVTVLTQPAGQSCSVANGSGNMRGSNLNIAVACTLIAPIVSVQPGVKQLQFNWATNPAATHYRVLEKPDGMSDYVQLGANLTSANYTLDLNGMLLSKRGNASYIIESCYSFGCTASAALALVSQLVNAIGYFKASNTESQDAFGLSLALSADGSTLAVGATNESSALSGVTAGTVDEATAGGNGAPGSGAVYVFSRSGTTWNQQAYVKASNPGANDIFGWSLALSGDGNTLAVGAPFEDSALTGVSTGTVDEATALNGANNSGAVYVFTRSGTAWSQQAYVKASNAGGDQGPGPTVFGDRFGYSLALSADGSTLAVGAHLESSALTGVTAGAVNEATAGNGADRSGAVYVFTRSGVTWTQQAYVKASNTGAVDWFGSSLALNGDGSTLAVGAADREAGVGEDSALTGVTAGAVNEATAGNGALNSGAVYVFTRSGVTWTQQAYVKASNTEANDSFGASVALSDDGNTLAVGAVNEAAAGNGFPSSGAVYVFSRSIATWSQQAYVKASNTGSGDQFGFSVALSGDGNTLAAGARNEDSAATGISGDQADNTAIGAGAVYVFTRSGSTWSQQAYVKASNAGTNEVGFMNFVGDNFGFALALSGDGNTLAVGALQEASAATGIGGNRDDNSALFAGAVYLY